MAISRQVNTFPRRFWLLWVGSTFYRRNVVYCCRIGDPPPSACALYCRGPIFWAKFFYFTSQAHCNLETRTASGRELILFAKFAHLPSAKNPPLDRAIVRFTGGRSFFWRNSAFFLQIDSRGSPRRRLTRFTWQVRPVGKIWLFVLKLPPAPGGL